LPFTPVLAFALPLRDGAAADAASAVRVARVGSGIARTFFFSGESVLVLVLVLAVAVADALELAARAVRGGGEGGD
jgi:hypothetical protein